jgi:hypothetical protein
MPNHPLYLGPQISSRTPQNRSTKNKYQIGSDPHLSVRLFRPIYAAVASQHLRAARPVLFLQNVFRRLLRHLNARKVRQIPDLLRQRAVSPLHDLIKALRIRGLSHETKFTTTRFASSLDSRHVETEARAIVISQRPKIPGPEMPDRIARVKRWSSEKPPKPDTNCATRKIL